MKEARLIRAKSTAAHQAVPGSTMYRTNRKIVNASAAVGLDYYKSHLTSARAPESKEALDRSAVCTARGAVTPSQHGRAVQKSLELD